jgi:hypothetical protein
MRLSAVLLHAVNEKIVRVQLVGHHQIINSRHGANYRVPASGLSILLIERENLFGSGSRIERTF